MPRKEHHVVPHKDGWAVKRNNAKRASRTFPKKIDAMKYGRDQSKKHKTELIPHKKDGTIQNPDSHGKDPCPPKDKK